MRNLLLLVTSMFVFMACQDQLELPEPVSKSISTEVVGNSPSGVIRTRAAFTPPDILTQLAQTQTLVNIKSAYLSHSYPYLSVEPKKEKLDTWTHDEGNFRQKWIINPSLLYHPLRVAGGINNAQNKRAYYYNWQEIKMLEPSYSSTGLLTIQPVPGEDFYYIGEANRIMSMKDYTSNTLTMVPKPTYFSALEKWNIIPCDELEIIDISFDFLAGDNFEVIPETVVVERYINPSPITRQVTETFSLEKTTQSTFSKTQKFSSSIKVSSTLKAKIPVILNGQINIDITASTEFSWQQGKTDIITEKKERTETYNIPPYTAVVLKKIEYKYNVDITYYAKAKTSSGAILYIPGRWKGLVVEATDYISEEMPL